jgi:MFS superfamily sulfate permease-like transporter
VEISVTKRSSGTWASARADLPAGLVVFLVAVPLCLGIAQASGAPLLSGLIAGVVGGVLVSAVSGSALSVSGPAAGLAVIVAAGIDHLGLRGFLLAVMLAGALQVLMGAFRLGAVAHFFPSAVIKGMLAAIGVLIILKQAPHAVGYDKEYFGANAFSSSDGNTFSTLAHAAGAFAAGAVLVSVLCAVVMLAWPKLQRGALKLVPPALVAVILGGVVATLLGTEGSLALAGRHLVSLPRFAGVSDVVGALVLPDFARILDREVWVVAVTLAIVASLETLLSLEAVDRLDPERRISPPNRELVAQGVGNLVSGLIGGLPITSVIVRSSANVQAGAQTRLAAIAHGLLLLVGVLFLAPLLNRVPLAALAVVLLFVGYKLTTPALWRAMWRAGAAQFVPFVVTVVAIVRTDLLKGTLIGVAVGLVFTIRAQQKNAVEVAVVDDLTQITFHKDMTFLQKARVKDVLRTLPEGGRVNLDRRKVDHVDDDIEEVLDEFAREAPRRSLAFSIQWEPGGEARRDARLARGRAGAH